MVQRQDFALHAAAAFDVDEGISAGSENIAGADYVRTSKKNQTVAVGVRVRLVVDDDGFAVEMQVFQRGSILVNREAGLRKGRLAGNRRRQAVQHVFLRDDL